VRLRAPEGGGANTAQHGGAQAPKHTLLQNPLYRGEIAHRSERYPGQHEAIIDAATWTAVLAQLALNRHARRIGSNVMASSLLAGLLFDEAGERLVPSQANKQGARYRYCISHRLKTSSAIAATPGTSSPIGPGSLFPSACATGLIGSDQQDLV